MILKEDSTEQKLRGAYYTPLKLAEKMVDFFKQDASIKSILEPSCGDGVFVDALVETQFLTQNRKVTAIEIEKNEAKKVAAKLKNNPNVSVVNRDFFEFYQKYKDINKYDLILGNPPYIRYQYLEEKQRMEMAEILTSHGMKANKLINTWVGFMVACVHMLSNNGKIAFVIPAEILQVADILKIKTSMDYPDDTASASAAAENAVEFQDVTFAYAGTGAPSLSDICFSVKKGQTVGIIGGTGSGKSTLVNLIARFYDATKGTIMINGQDIRTYSQHELRKKIGVVPQRAALFKGTIRENMKWGREDATDEEIWDALTTAQAREIVEGKDGQLNFKLEQNGRNLSGGQRQRLTIARAVVKKPEFLILDDSASALDFATDAALRKSLHQLSGNITTFLVSQRAASIRQADLILVLNDGELVGKGIHDDLIRTCDIYREIYFSQFPEERAKYTVSNTAVSGGTMEVVS